MGIVRGILDRLLLITAMVAGGLVPGFIAQYRQRLGGRLEQARLDLEPWQRLADQYQHGDLTALINYHLASADRTFHEEGRIIQHLVSTVTQLEQAVAALHGNLLQQIAYLLLHADPAVLKGTWADWVPTFALSGAGLLFAALFALGVWLLFQLLWWAVGALRPARSLRASPKAPASR